MQRRTLLQAMLKTVLKLAAALALVLPALPFAFANDAHHSTDATPSAKTENSAASMSEGEVKKVDKEAGKVTIKHGELKNLGMPAMTMVFRVKDRSMLDGLKPGDRIGFIADKIGGQLTVMRLEVKS